MAEHGTNARYQKHYRDGEEACDPCKAARRERSRLRPPPTPEQRARKSRLERQYYAAMTELRRRYPGEYLRILNEIQERNAQQS